MLKVVGEEFTAEASEPNLEELMHNALVAVRQLDAALYERVREGTARRSFSAAIGSLADCIERNLDLYRRGIA